MLQHRIVHCTNLFQFLLVQSDLLPHMYHSVGTYVRILYVYVWYAYVWYMYAWYMYVWYMYVWYMYMVLMMLQSSTDRYQLLPTPPLYWWLARFTCNCVTEVTERQVNQQSVLPNRGKFCKGLVFTIFVI